MPRLFRVSLLLALWPLLPSLAWSEPPAPGLVRLPQMPGNIDPHLELHLLHAGRYLEGDLPQREIAPRKPVSEIGEGVLLPAGKAIGALWDRKSKRYVALSRPFRVEAHKTVEIPFEPPKNVAHLFVQVQRHTVATKAADLALELVLRQGREERPPDLLVTAADRAYGVWYGLEPGPAEVRARSGQTFLGPLPLDLLAGRIEHLTDVLQPRPALDVQLDLPETLRPDELDLVVRRVPAGEILADHILPPGAVSHRFEGLPAVRLEVDLRTRFGIITHPVDLGSGADGFLRIVPELIALRGTVLRGDEGEPAELVFNTVAGETVRARAGDDGAYEIVGFDPLLDVVILQEGKRGARYADIFSPPIAESAERDFQLEDAEDMARVVDAVTGAGIPGAAVLLQNPGQERKSLAGGYFVAGPTDEDGRTPLPFPSLKSLELRAMAEGYLPMKEPVRFTGREAAEVFEVRLQPLGKPVELRLRLPDGTPAAGAQVSLLDLPGTEARLFTAGTNAEGVVEPPRQPGLLLIKHPAAGFLVREWRPGDGDEAVEWSLPSAAGRPLTVQVRDASGKGAAGAELALWVGGRHLSGPTLQWLTGSHHLTDATGLWSGRNLPRGPVHILAWRAGTNPAEQDPQPTAVPFPWPDPVEVQAVE